MAPGLRPASPPPHPFSLVTRLCPEQLSPLAAPAHLLPQHRSPPPPDLEGRSFPWFTAIYGAQRASEFRGAPAGSTASLPLGPSRGVGAGSGPSGRCEPPLAWYVLQRSPRRPKCNSRYPGASVFKGEHSNLPSKRGENLKPGEGKTGPWG